MMKMCLARQPASVPASQTAELSAATAAVVDWLDSHTRCLEMWRDLLTDRGESPELVATLDRQAVWLRRTVREAME